MDLQFGDLYNALLGRISEVPEIKWIDADIGQLESYAAGYRPAVNFPCVLVDFDEWTFEDAGDNTQTGSGIVVARLAFTPFTSSSNATPQLVRETALKYFDLENSLYKKLHGWAGISFSTMRLVSLRTEKRNDNIRVRVLRFASSVRLTSAKPARTTIARPSPKFGGDITP